MNQGNPFSLSGTCVILCRYARTDWAREDMLATTDLIHEATQPQRLAAVLPRWLNEIPLYRRGPAVPEAAGAELVLAALKSLPFITKQDIRHNFPENFLGAGVDLETLVEDEVIELEHTSGTSEQHRTPLLLPLGWWADQERRALKWNALAASVFSEFPTPRRVTISSPVCNSEVCFTGVPSMRDRIAGHTLFVSLSRFPFLWSEADLARIAHEVAEWQPQFLDVDPVYGVVFALYCERHGIRFPSLRFVLASYEFVSINHRRILERAFGVPVLNLYGSTETGHLLMESGVDEAGCMLPSHETAFLEVVQQDTQGIGDLVVTTLTNSFMPLIRYRIGDLVEKHPDSCRTTYLVHGRAADALTLPSGSRVTVLHVDRCFEGLEGFAHYQLSELAGGQWLLRFVPDRERPADTALQEIRMRMARLLELESASLFQIEPAMALMAENSGKFRLVYPTIKNPL
jgi:phenylacetate-CoA ligase